jgi:Zn-dependent protease with chaperone function
MALTQERFDVLIKRIEVSAHKQPVIYRFRVGLLAALGYAYIFLVLAGLLAIFGAIVLLVIHSGRINGATIKICILVLVPVAIALRSLWVNFPPPVGLEMTRKEVPRLFELVDELTAKLNAPKLHCILLTSEFNASIVQIPHLGILGWQQNYLLLGLPLMQALSPHQFRAVLAHELGHLSGNHSRFAGWIYRVQKTYDQILERLHQAGHQSSFAIFENFFNWYAPFFSAYSFVLRRMDEYEADRCASELAGAKNTAEALINVEVKARFLESFWSSTYKQVDHQVEPPATAFTNLSNAWHTIVNPQDETQWLDQALAQKTSNADTHPCLADRLAALGYGSQERQKLLLPAPAKAIAAQQFLGNALNRITAHFDQIWSEAIVTSWRQRFAYAQEVQKNLQALEEKAQHQPLTIEEAWNRACWTEEFKGQEAAIALFQDLLKTQPNHAAANYALGQILLQQQNSQGISFLEKGMKLDPDYVLSGCELIYYFLKQQGEIEKANTYQQRAEKHYELVLQAKQERSIVSDKDKFQPHNLPASQVQRLRQQLSNSAQVKEAYLVRKVVNHFPDKPLYVLGIRLHRSWWKLYGSDHDKEFLDKFSNEMEFSGSVYLIILNNLNEQNGSNKKLGKILSKIETAPIYLG